MLIHIHDEHISSELVYHYEIIINATGEMVLSHMYMCVVVTCKIFKQDLT